MWLTSQSEIKEKLETIIIPNDWSPIFFYCVCVVGVGERKKLKKKKEKNKGKIKVYIIQI